MLFKLSHICCTTISIIPTFYIIYLDSVTDFRNIGYPVLNFQGTKLCKTFIIQEALLCQFYTLMIVFNPQLYSSPSFSNQCMHLFCTFIILLFFSNCSIFISLFFYINIVFFHFFDIIYKIFILYIIIFFYSRKNQNIYSLFHSEFNNIRI